MSDTSAFDAQRLLKQQAESRKVTATSEWTHCPICDELLPVAGPNGVVPHILDVHHDEDLADAILEAMGT